MTDVTTGSEVRLRKNTSSEGRLVGAGLATFVLFISVCNLATWNGYAEIVAALVGLVIGVAMLYEAAFGADELWTIALDMIVVEKTRPFGQPNTRFIRREEISGIRINRDKANPTCFRLALQLTSGERLISPQLPEVTHVRETTARIAEQLSFVDIDPPVNPLDATNLEMRIGEPVRKAAGTERRIVALIIAGLCAIRYAYRFWNGAPLTTAEIIFGVAVAVIALLSFRYAHTSAGAFWIVHHGELRVERLTRDGKPIVDTITGSDVATIGLAPDSRAEGELYVVRIDLLSGQKFLSQSIGTKEETQAVSDEIARRLGIAPEGVCR
ncbi:MULTISPECIES: hypothetical protein [unclassified Bradyrhizobium]|uniref:hypothetical protein n=1 Tax=unclassified Bradyrhizobium TaxID=2631580 RepID=UPI0015C96A06|nr:MULTISPECIES: hypothetical protein [unclassified Bradyrhizobium]MBB4262774.1 hypothetical protein [Bradyrhizobium sp. CIR3A]NYG50430.1 hypothetical protein [Bradyrhizobium sp. IAR9]